MEPQYQQQYNGQAVQKQDLELIGETSGLADDRVYAELFRMTPFSATVAKGILPYGHTTVGNLVRMVAPNGGTGSVLVQPFRALVGSRTAEAAGARACWRDIRSGLSVAESATSLGTAVSFAANASGNPRWDLVYAAVNVAAVSTPTPRLVKDVDDGVVAPENVSIYKHCTVTLQVAQGTAAASPVWPALPADAGTTYNIPIAYIRIENGFSSGSSVGNNKIALQAPIIQMSRATGVSNVSVATSMYKLSTARQQAWGAGTRPNVWIPPDMSGGETLIATVDMRGTSNTLWSHQSGDVLDERDWRNRLARVCVQTRGPGYSGASADAHPWNLTEQPAASGNTWDSTLGRFMAEGVTGGDVDTYFAFCNTLIPFEGTQKSLLGSFIICDHADGGKLKVELPNPLVSPNQSYMIWIEFSGPYTNR